MNSIAQRGIGGSRITIRGQHIATPAAPQLRLAANPEYG
jgi:hypothetical protein